MRRRGLITGLLLAATISRARAQQPAKVYRMALVVPSTPIARMSSVMSETSSYRFYRQFFKELRRLGYVEGQNLVIERYSGEARTENFAELARDVVRSNPDLIYAESTRLVLAFKAATATIPIVGNTSDPVANGIVPSLARPGGNITGVSSDAGLEILGKRLELLRAAVPGVSKVGSLCSRQLWELAEGAALREAAQRERISLIGPPLEEPLQEAEYRRVFAAMAQAGAEALLVVQQPENFTNRQVIIELADKGRLPAIYPFRESAELGGLMAYALDLVELFRHAANAVGQVLSGTSPGDVPYYQVTKFELVINLKTAKALGLTIPPSLLAVADEVIE